MGRGVVDGERIGGGTANDAPVFAAAPSIAARVWYAVWAAALLDLIAPYRTVVRGSVNTRQWQDTPFAPKAYHNVFDLHSRANGGARSALGGRSPA